MKYIIEYKKASKYEGFSKIYYISFDSYYELQKHLLRYRFVNSKDYTVYRETKIKRYNKYAG